MKLRLPYNLWLQLSLGPDGMPALFYQKYWDVVKGDVVSPTRVTEYRPISLFNVLYKIISKIMANLLKKALPHVISKFHSAFIPGRMILDNVLAVFETVHYLKRWGKVRRRKLMLKLDMAKAYD
ncbi:hypothetical protein L3X38_003053 [Prunus dulcis]|uniref:Reverse transcriptase domain-containing protein n=1 Tax=Prunus dulcis TaxID=3755 RepID=A0AAD4X070_PRUDU|nr:hypothetical protein L3X38_003053 [Prunus dulcis]